MELETEVQECFDNIDNHGKSFLNVEDILIFFNQEFDNNVDRLLVSICLDL